MGIYKTTISELGDDEVYTSLQKRLDEIRDIPVKTEDRGDQIVGLLELTARVQGRLFEALNEEGVNDQKVLPLMASGRLGIPTHKVSENTELKLIKENLNKSRQLDEQRKSADYTQLALERELNLEKTVNKDVDRKNQLLKSELDFANSRILNTTAKLNQTSEDLRVTQLDNALLKTAPSYLYKYSDPYYYGYYSPYYKYKYGYDALSYPYYSRYRSYLPYYPYYSYADGRYWRSKYDEEYARVKTDLALAKADTKALLATSKRDTKACDLILGDITNDARRRRLIDKYADLFTGERLYVMKSLRGKIQEEDTIKRIIYTTVVESFRSAQRSFREFRHRARRAVVLGSVLPSTEADVHAYMIRNLDLYDYESTIFEVVRHLNADPLLPNNINYKVILRNLITELGKIAFEMQSVFPTLDIESGYQGEIFSEDKFRRTFDAEFTAPLIGAHLWPPLINAEDNSIVLKGECATRHSPFSDTAKRFKEVDNSKSKRSTKSRGRSASPIRGRKTKSASPSRN